MAEQLFAFTNDDAGGENPHLFAELLDFLKSHEMVATFFVVPMSGARPLYDKPEWLALLERAQAAGHELQLHALDHGSTFEFGVPPDFMLDIIPDAKARWQQEPEVIQAEHTLANMSERDEMFKYAAGGFRDFTRIASSDPRMWRDIALANRDALLNAIRRFNGELATVEQAVERGDGDALLRVFEQAKQARDAYVSDEHANKKS